MKTLPEDKTEWRDRLPLRIQHVEVEKIAWLAVAVPRPAASEASSAASLLFDKDDCLGQKTIEKLPKAKMVENK